MLRILALFLVVILLASFPAQAADCRIVEGQNFCLNSLQRSAKHYWEYWASVSADGGSPSKVVFNCRDRIQVTIDSKTTPFRDNGLGNVVCQLYRR